MMNLLRLHGTSVDQQEASTIGGLVYDRWNMSNDVPQLISPLRQLFGGGEPRVGT